jgi:tetratricopeptide (TPR) repeat protein
MESGKNACFEEEVFLEEMGISLLYTFSNEPRDSQNAIEKKTGYLIPINDTEWQMNPELSQNIQKIMKEKNFIFCTTSFVQNDTQFIYINRRCGNFFSIMILEEDITPIEQIAAGIFGRKAEKFIEDTKYSQAIVASSQSLRFDPNSSRALSIRAWAYYNKGDFDLSLTDYSKAISIEPKAATLYILRARVFNAKNQNEQTLHDLLNAFELDPDGTGKRLFKDYGINDYKREVINELIKSLREQDKNID